MLTGCSDFALRGGVELMNNALEVLFDDASVEWSKYLSSSSARSSAAF